MFDRHTKQLLIVLVLGLMLSSAHADLVGNWKFDDGAGDVATDKSGNGNHGTLVGGSNWVAGIIGSGALSFDSGDGFVEIAHDASLDLPDALTIAAWVNLGDLSTYYFVVHKGPSGTAGNNYPGNFALRTEVNSGRLQLLHQTSEGQTFATYNSDLTVTAGQWHHVAATLVKDGPVNLYIDGVPTGTTDPSQTFGVLNKASVKIGGRTDSYSFWKGEIDDVQIYNHALTMEEIQATMTGLSFEIAGIGSPADGAVDVFREVRLSWTPGVFASTHNVYLGTAFDDVSAADIDTPMDVLVSLGQTEDAFEAGILEFGQTYYWRVDEVNGAPDNTVYQGDVWSFTVEPLSIPITNITATASSSFGASGPEKSIDGSGLVDDLHGVSASDMWISGGVPATIEYAFDRAYKLHELWVWNSNQLIEAFVGFGAKDVVIEYSLDGENWTILEGVGPLAQAPGAASYAQNNTIDFGGVTAQHVRVTVNSVQGIAPQASLSEVRFYAIPTLAARPDPASGATDVSPDTALSWGRSGREADHHDLYVGTDANDLASVGSTGESSFSTDAVDLQLGQTYSWRVDEVNDAMDPSVWTGTVWRFTTVDTLTIDDMESYEDAEFLEIWATWVDGFDDPANGSTVGADPTTGDFSPETNVVHAGSQSLPLHYDNSAAAGSEATRTFDAPMDWTRHGVQSLSLFFRGASENVGGQLYVKINNTKISYDADAVTLSRAIWHPWTIDLSSLGVDLSQVSSVTIGVEDAGAMGVVYIDTIELYAALDPHAALANHIPVFSATASTFLGGNFNRMEAFAIDGSGLNADGSHTVAPDGFMWLNNGVFAQPNDSEPEIVFDLGAVYAVDTMLVWNYNEAGNFTKRGVGSARILTAGADGVFSVLIENQAFDEAPGVGDVDFRQTIDLAGVKAQFIKLDISANLGGDNEFVGLSEVQFEGTLSP